MSNRYFKQAASTSAEATMHPQLRAWAGYQKQAGGDIRVELSRSRDALGFGPPQLQVIFLDASKVPVRPDQVPWKPELDDWLLSRRARAVNIESEALRFALRIRVRSAPLLEKWGDGYFNAVFIEVVRQGPFRSQNSILNLMSEIHEYAPSPEPSLAERIADVDDIFVVLARELLDLGYDETTAEVILLNALCIYLDERFHISVKRSLFGAYGRALSHRKTAALAIADTLERLIEIQGNRSLSAYFYEAIRNIEQGDAQSVQVNWPIVVKEAGDALPEGFAPQEIKDELTTMLTQKLATHEPDTINAACELLVDTIGGDAKTYQKTWSTPPSRIKSIVVGDGAVVWGTLILSLDRPALFKATSPGPRENIVQHLTQIVGTPVQLSREWSKSGDGSFWIEVIPTQPAEFMAATRALLMIADD